ncbi:uncharacterized protein LOC103722496 isoform X2 [Phoenix dactylifera]|nr:uncharacterized protein LOC103722496 isoform X2 [Phoenix dactylifera]XP_026655785.2 uncharacterized protein LOC103722496 isoform X2 [Phoenix dactylifera]XP_026655787.2 uncharacterized protein LOC103722496 isoform X2 [Phoenix dactylifera]XP_026655790.2 uncharacterized protein LOC103722496 isoform X2 [Phoenix dactylifera]XP_026655793.2 uncharacterized protein LOC103722496 isoform X2 [Phoenix dactylifera]
MFCGHTRTNSNVAKVAGRRSRTLFKRAPDHNNYQFTPKECEVPGLMPRNSEQRWIIFALFALEADAYWKLAPFLPPLRGADQKNHVGSGVSSDMDGLESLSPPPAIIVPVDLPKEKKINWLEHTDSAKPLPMCSSSGGVIPKGDKTVKRSSRKRGKKKGKQYKKATSEKVSAGCEIQHEQSICVPSVSDTTTNSDVVCLGEGMSENSVSEKATSTSLSIEDTSVEKDDSDNNHEYADCSRTLVSCTSYSNDMVEPDQVSSLSLVRAGEESNCNSTASMNNALSTTQTPEIILSTFDDDNKNANPKQNSNFSDNPPSISFDPYNTSVQDSYLNGWNSDIRENRNDDGETLLSIEDESGFNSSGGGMISDSRNSDTSCQTATVNLYDINTEMLNDGCIGNSCWSKDVVNTCNSIERAPCSSQAYNSNDFHPVISGKRGRRARKMTGGANQNVPNRFPGVTGKENNHSVWQKVQKIDMEACICETETVNAVSPQDNTSSKHSNIRIRFGTCVGLKQNQSGKTCKNACSDEVVKTDLCNVTSNIVSTSEVASELIDGNSMNNVQKKASSAFKQANHYSRKGSYAAKVNMNRVSKNHVPQNEGMPILPQVIHEKHISGGLRSPCSIEFQQILVAPADKIDHCRRESQQKAENYLEKATSSGNRCRTACGVSLPATYNDGGASTSDSSDQVCIEGTSDIHSTRYSKEEFCHTDSEENHCLKLEMESSQKECSKLDSSTGSVLQKWVPVGRKESTMSNMTHLDNMNVSIVEDLFPDKLESRNVKAEVSTSNTQYFTPLTRGQFPCSSPRAEDKDFSSGEADQVNSRLRNHPYVAEESGGVIPVSSCQTHEVQNEGFSRFETDLDKILLAVHDAYKFHMAAGAHQASGSPLADIERFLYSASPVIGQTHSIGSRRTCSKEQLIGDSMCLHHIPNISLKRLWQWYEEPGCFGLEVKAQEYHNSKRLCNGYSEFSAYFVPYLSAVQLFGRSRNTRHDSANEVAAIGCEAEKTLETPLSNLRSLPIFSMLLPQPFNGTDKCSSDSSSSAKYECSDQFYRSTRVGDEELIFEYFESDQPPWRRPLFEKIKELIGGDTLSNCRAFGDPLMLENINLHDLHPASWYSVAWYPIYRIPDGNFHAAFLTYHSLGHFVHRSFSSSPSDGLSCIASPVVGLLSYNDKGECWFKLKNSYSKVIRNEEARFFNPSEILKERLRSLKQTATVMARASVSKGNRRSVNRHPDYEFFVSQSR